MNFKKNLLSFSLIIFCLTLTSCKIPLIDKYLENLTPQNEIGANEIMDLMYSEIAKRFSVEYESTLIIGIQHKEDKTSLKSDTKNDSLSKKLYGNEAVVLGVDNIDNSLEEDLNTFFEPNIDSLISNQDEIEIELSIKGKAVKLFDNSFKTHTNVDINYDVGEMMLRSKAEIITMDDRVYIKADELPMTLLFTEGKMFADKWFYIDQNETLSFLDEAARKSYDVNEKIDPMLFQKEIINVIKGIVRRGIDSQLWKSDKMIEDPTNNNEYFHLQTELNNDSWLMFIEKFYNIYTKSFNKENPNTIKNSANNPLFLDYADKFNQVFNFTEGEIWINKSNNQELRSKFNVNIDTSKGRLFESKLFDRNLNIKISVDTKYSNINTPITIDKPSESESLIKTIDDTIIIPWRKSIRNLKRVNDINQIQIALEAYHGDTNEYPQELNFDQELSYENINYIGKLPINPKPNDGKCEKDFEYSYQISNDKQSYELNYCLGETLAGIPAGYQTATPEELYQYKKFTNNNKDIFSNIFFSVELADETYYATIIDLNSDPLVLTNAYRLKFHQKNSGNDNGYNTTNIIKITDNNANGESMLYMPLSKIIKITPLSHNDFVFQSITEKELILKPEAKISDTGEPYNDTDSDNLNNLAEEFYNTDPNNPDTDGDTYNDGDEVKSGFNPRGEGNLMEFLIKAYEPIQSKNQDPDNDGLNNISEIIQNTNPNIYDTDGDGQNDLEELKYREDRSIIKNNESINEKTEETLMDTDNDGLPDLMETMIGTDPEIADTDADGYSDSAELKDGFNPKGEGRVLNVTNDDTILFRDKNCEYCDKIEEWLKTNNVSDIVEFKVLNVNSDFYSLFYFQKKMEFCKNEILLIPALWDGENSKCEGGYFGVLNFFKERTGIKE